MREDRFTGKVAFVTGAARGQGRNHAIRLAQEGADVILVDLAKDVDTIGYDMATPDDLAETVRRIETLGRRVVWAQADVRDTEAMTALVDRGVAELGRLDIVIANAGVASSLAITEMTDAHWDAVIDINLTGVFKTIRAAAPHLQAGASVIIISSIGGLVGLANNTHYSASKHGVIGIMRALAAEFGPRNIRINTVNPTNVDTRMLFNDSIYKLFRPELPAPTRDDIMDIVRGMHILPTGWIEVDDVSNAVLFLASDEARFITGITLPVDAGLTVR
jgi:SDR family mycofactocin-dependent oxidoreductase